MHEFMDEERKLEDSSFLRYLALQFAAEEAARRAQKAAEEEQRRQAEKAERAARAAAYEEADWIKASELEALEVSVCGEVNKLLVVVVFCT